MKLISMEHSEYRKNDFKHPDHARGIMHSRWELKFEVPNLDYDPDIEEDEYNCPTVFSTVYATSYYNKDEAKASNPKEFALKDIKKSILATCNTWKESGHTDDIKDINIEYYRRDIDAADAGIFIKHFFSGRNSFAIDELSILDDYAYIYYSTAKLINAFFDDCLHDAPIFTDSDEFIQWLES